MYVDVAALLAGGLFPPEPDVLPFSDDFCLFYSGEFNLILGDTESGKTWLCLAAAVAVLQDGGKAAIIDLDHNGAQSIVNSLLQFGVSAETLSDTECFRLTEPTDRIDLKEVVGDLTLFRPGVVTIDSLGEVLPLFRYNSNSADDFTVVHADVIKPLSRQGAAVLVVDHLAKNADSRAQGPTGTTAKTRAVGGVAVRVTTDRSYRPGEGGSSKLELHKDRHGGIRKHYPTGQAHPIIGTFELAAEREDRLSYQFRSGLVTQVLRPREDAELLAADVAKLRAAHTTKPTVREARTTLESGQARAQRAVRAYDSKRTKAA